MCLPVAIFPHQVIEKAYKKLRLDALVIQQGRLTENVKGVGKDDLLAMVRYGAEMVFSGGTVRRGPAPVCVLRKAFPCWLSENLHHPGLTCRLLMTTIWVHGATLECTRSCLLTPPVTRAAVGPGDGCGH